VGPSYGMQFQNGAVIGCGIVSGALAPDIVDGVNFSAYTDKCQGEANRAESLAIERYRPNLIVWVSTDERSSIVAGTSQGSPVLVSGSEKWKKVMLQRMETRVEKFRATGANVVLVLEPPAFHGGSKTQPNASDLAYEEMNALLTTVATRHPHGVATVNLQSRVCPSGPPCPFVVNGFGSKGATIAQGISRAIRPDGLHYGPEASLWVARWLVPRLAAEEKSL
jgi:hypothetical protein